MCGVRKHAMKRKKARSAHQADNLAKLRNEVLSVLDMIAQIFGAISRAKIKQIKEHRTKLCGVRKHAMKRKKGAKRTSSRQFGETAERCFVHA